MKSLIFLVLGCLSVFSSGYTEGFLSEYLKPGYVVFDVGAHIGSKTSEYLETQPKLVVCVEPQPAIFKTLYKKFRKESNVVLVQKGLGRERGVATMNICTIAPTISSFSEKWKEGRFKNYTWPETIQVEMIRLQDLIDKYGLPDYCKIDVEGYESEVLKGLDARVPLLSFEFTYEVPENTTDSMDKLHVLGFEEYNFIVGEGKYMYLDSWLPKDEFLKAHNAYLEENKDNAKVTWGDIYAR